MRKMKILSALLVVLLTVTTVTPAFALPGLPSICSGVALQNTSSQSTPVTLEFYYKDSANPGTVDYTYNLSPDLAGGGSKALYIPSILPSTLADGIYSVVVTSQQLLNSQVNEVSCNPVSASNTTGDKWVYASHSGVNAANTGTIVYLGYIVSRAYSGQNWSSEIAIQNAGTQVATNVKIEFFKSGQSTAVETFTNTSLAVGAVWYLDLGTASSTYATAALNDFRGAAKITSDQAVAAVANYAPNYTDITKTPRLQSYNGVAEPNATSAKLYVPQAVKHAYSQDFTSGFTVYNPNATETPITVKFIRSGETAPVFTYDTTIPANSAWIQYLGSFTPAQLPDKFAGTATIEVSSGSNKILGVASLDSALGQAGALNMVRDEDKATTLYFPQMTRAYPPGFNGGFAVANTSANDLGLTITYTKSDGTTFIDTSKTVSGNSVLIVYVGGVTNLVTPWNGGVKVQVTSGTGALVGQGNQTVVSTDALIVGDTELIYNAFTQ